MVGFIEQPDYDAAGAFVSSGREEAAELLWLKHGTSLALTRRGYAISQVDR